MGIVYSDNDGPASRYPVRYENLDATKHWLTHFGNHCYLSFIFKNSQDRTEKHQANKEISIADKKMAYWRRHPNFDVQNAEAGKLRILNQWAQK